MKILLILLLGLSLWSCGTKQDPLDGRDPSILNAKPPVEKKPDPVHPVQSDIVRLDVGDGFLNCLEGRTDRWQFGARFLGVDKFGNSDHTLELSIENLNDFPGAIFDSQTGTLEWTPESGTVVGSDLVTQMKMKIVAIARPLEQAADQTFYSNSQMIVVNVSRSKKVPEIVKVENLPSSMIENEELSYGQFRVTIRDEDSVATNTPPTLLVNAATQSTVKNLTPFIRFIRAERSVSDLKLWTVYMNINLKDAELTSAREAFGFSLVAVSYFGIKSAAVDKVITVYSDMAMAISSLTEEVTVEPLVTTKFSFYVLDPKSEGRVEADLRRSNLPSNVQLNCKSRTVSVTVCEVLVTPSKEQANTVLSGQFEVKNYNVKDNTKYKTSIIRFGISVNKLPPPPPPPQPTPAPQPEPQPPAPAPTPQPNPAPAQPQPTPNPGPNGPQDPGPNSGSIQTLFF